MSGKLIYLSYQADAGQNQQGIHKRSVSDKSRRLPNEADTAAPPVAASITKYMTSLAAGDISCQL